MKKATRDRLVLPLLLPLGALVVIAIPVLLFSRVLLSVSANAATVTALAVAVSIMLAAARLASLPRVRAATLVGMLGAVAGVAMIAGGVALATVGSGEKEPEGPVGPPPKLVAITAPTGAAATGFDPDKVTGPAGVPLAIEFDNQDTDTHNVHLSTDEEFTDSASIAVGKVFAGPGKETIPVGTLDEGEYYFRCDVHPTTMTGELEAKPEAGGEPGGESPAPGGESPAPGGESPAPGGESPAPGGESPGGTEQPPPGGTPAGSVEITAQNLAFDKTTLALPTGKVTIHFVNNDAGIPHNVDIYEADPATDPSAKALFEGEPVTGPGSVDYSLEAPPPGSYFFHCEFHPDTMKGTVTVA